jgi:alanyl-tRNA synthetase
MSILEAELAALGEGRGGVFNGEMAFKLHDTFGFPLDLTADICRERGVTVDAAGFEAAMSRQKEAARAAGKFRMSAGLEYRGPETRFHGYETLERQGKVLALYREGSPVDELREGDTGTVVLDETPFYAESGGQAGDRGALQSARGIFAVEDTQKIQTAVFGHQGVLKTGLLAVGETVGARVDAAARKRTMRNHSVTHLMHKALREVLGPHVQQRGSLVDADKTRFDFAHGQPVTDEEIRRVEKLVNAEILENAECRYRVMPIAEAQKEGAVMLFGEKYGDRVRVVDVGSSRELCGGTHVARTGDIGMFTIAAEGGVAAGVRRVEAITGDVALAYMQGMETALGGVAGTLKVQPSDVQARVYSILDQVRQLERELTLLKSKQVAAQGEGLLGRAVDVKGVKVLAATLEDADIDALRATMDKLRDKLKTAAVVLATARGGKVTLIAGVTVDLVGRIKAGELVNFVARQVGGRGGGRPDMAQAGGTEPDKLPAALASVREWVGQRL